MTIYVMIEQVLNSFAEVGLIVRNAMKAVFIKDLQWMRNVKRKLHN